MTKQHEEAVALADEFGWRIPHPYNDKTTANIFTDAELAALIAEVRRNATAGKVVLELKDAQMIELNIDQQLLAGGSHIHLNRLASANNALTTAIRAKLEGKK